MGGRMNEWLHAWSSAEALTFFAICFSAATSCHGNIDNLHPTGKHSGGQITFLFLLTFLLLLLLFMHSFLPVHSFPYLTCSLFSLPYLTCSLFSLPNVFTLFPTIRKFFQLSFSSYLTFFLSVFLLTFLLICLPTQSFSYLSSYLNFFLSVSIPKFLLICLPTKVIMTSY